MKKISQKSQTNDKKSTKLISICAIFMLVVVGVVVYQVVQSKAMNIDKVRFVEAEGREQMAFKQLMNGVGETIRTEDQKRCYNSEQGPYNDGRLWCEVSSVGYFAQAKSEAEINQVFEDIISSNGWEVTNKRAADLEFAGAEGIPCELIINGGSLAVEPGLGFSDEPASKQAIVVSCADRAKAKHYPFVD